MTENNTNEEAFLVELITDYRAEGMRREKIAAELNVTLSEIKRLIRKHGITRPLKEDSNAEVVVPLSPTHGIPLMDQAKKILGPRMAEDWSGYKLDGMYSNTRAIVEAAGLKYSDEV